MTKHQCPSHLLPALHLYIRAVAAGLDLQAFNGPYGTNPFGEAAKRVVLVERERDAARVVTTSHARECMEEDARRSARWNGRRWTA